MDRLAGWCLLVEQGEQFAELARAVLESDYATHLAIVDPEARQQINGAVALVLKLTPRWPPACWWPTWHGRLVGCGRLAYANARLLVDAEQRAVGGRVEE